MKLWSISEQSRKRDSKDTHSDSDRRWVMIFLIGAQGFLTAGTVFALIYGMGTTWQLLLGLNLFVFAGLLRAFRRGRKKKSKINEQPRFENQFSLNDEKSYLM